MAFSAILPVSAWAQAMPAQSVVIPGTELAIDLVQLPAGQFQMGSPASESARDDDEGPVHAVSLPTFWISIHEVTHRQYSPFRFESFDSDAGPAGEGAFSVDAVTRPSPPYEDPSHGMGGDDHPMTGVTRWNALHYARWLSEKTGRLFRLPTEAEWEYACRAGGTAAFGAGLSDAVGLSGRAWLETESGGIPHPVGSLRANAWGLYDMHGNAAEWVLDGYQADAYLRADGGAAGASGSTGANGAIMEPFAGEATRGRGVVRGGAFDDPAAEARCAARYPEAAAWKRRDPQIPKSRWWNTDSPHVGFRLVSPAQDHTMEEIRQYFDALLGG